jgi:NAD(P)-dependent dehydrogenase (short-subunit alcohol dehydrogenase family)
LLRQEEIGMGRLDGKVAVITGGAGGIGRVTGQRFVQEGAQVLLVDLADDALRDAVHLIGSDRASYVVADVTQSAQVRRYVHTAVERYGGIDIFFDNAGVEGVVTPLTEYPEDIFDQVMAVNVRGAWLGIKYVMPEMERRGGGSIIITSSIVGVQGSPNQIAYSISKHAVIGLMRGAALAGGAKGIRVNTVNPGPIETRMMQSIEAGAAPGEIRARLQARTPLGRYGRPDEVANVVLFLASDESSYCTGGVYMVDGARSAG